MSEYQYYEFQAIDRPLSAADREALRAISSRARITATSFTNSYEWGNFKGDPVKLMDRWFDLHLYVTNWGSRRLMIRVPARSIDQDRLEAFIGEADCVGLRAFGENLILDIEREEMDDDEADDGSGWLAALAPLRADLLAGDERLLYLLWLTAVETEAIGPDEAEPLPGLGPMTGALEAFVDFFGMDPDLVAAAAERSATANAEGMGSDAARLVIAAVPECEKTALLIRLFDGDPHVAAELRAEVRKTLDRETEAPRSDRRTAGELRARADAIRLAREHAAAEKAAEAQRRQAEAAEDTRRVRLNLIRHRGENVWREVEDEIERRNATGYDRAAMLLSDLRALAEADGTTEAFLGRLHALRERHVQKKRFLERLAAIA